MKNAFLPLICGSVLLLAFSSLASAQIDPAFREEGVLYFDENLPAPVTGTLHVNTTVYANRDFQNALAALYPGQKIELLGMSSEGYLVKTTYRNNTVSGWIRPDDLPSGIDPALFAEAKKNQAHREVVDVAIKNKNVIQGMTPDEVKESVGRPEQISTRSDPHGSQLAWIYRTYREEPQYQYTLDSFGRALLQTYYVKVPIGQMIITFSNGTVYSIEQRKVDPSSTGVVTN